MNGNSIVGDNFCFYYRLPPERRRSCFQSCLFTGVPPRIGLQRPVTPTPLSSPPPYKALAPTSPCTGPLDMFKCSNLSNLDLTVEVPPLDMFKLEQSSTWTSLYRVPHLGYVQTFSLCRSLCKRAFGIRLKCFIFFVIFKQEFKAKKIKHSFNM